MDGEEQGQAPHDPAVPPMPPLPGVGLPPPPPQTLYTFGDIAVTPDSILIGGSRYPLAGSIWTVTNHTMTRQKISAAGWILTAIFVWVCLLGLLFLLMKEDYLDGYVQVTVQAEGTFHSVQIPVSKLPQIGELEHQVAAVQNLSMGLA